MYSQQLSQPTLNIYTDFELCPELPVCQMLYPFKAQNIEHDGYKAFEEEAENYLRLVAQPNLAHVAVLPFDGSQLTDAPRAERAKYIALAKQFAREAQKNGLKTIILTNSDNEKAISIPGAIIYRTSIVKSAQRENERLLAAWHEDLLDTYLDGQVQTSAWSEAPQVGFCGLAASDEPSLPRRLKMKAKETLAPLGIRIRHTDGLYLRKDAMDGLKNHPGVKTQFKVNTHFFANVVNDPTSRLEARMRFLDNLLGSQYVLCARGWGNWSFRLYEAMQVGRIPVILDTDMVLPFADIIPWQEIAVIVPEQELSSIGDRVEAFHRQLSPEALANLQLRIRDIYDRYLRPRSFFCHLAQELRQEAISTAPVALPAPTQVRTARLRSPSTAF